MSRHSWTPAALAALALLALPLTAPPAAAQATVPVASYGFDEASGVTVLDASGHGNNGTISGATRTANGMYARALVFDGVSSIVTIPNAANLHLTTGMTLEAWINPSAVSPAWRDVIYRGSDNYFLEATSDQNGGAPTGGITVSGGSTLASASGPLTPNTWVHLAVTYNGANLILYVNGVQASSVARTGSIASSTSPLQIGGDSVFGQYFAGTIDEVRVYNVALTPAQIQADMVTPLANIPSAPGNLVATTMSNTRIDLGWSPATSNLGIADYRVERCQGAGCTGFAEVGIAPATSYSDAGLVANSVYRYRVRATDTQGNRGVASAVVDAQTGLAISPVVATLTFTRTQQFAANAGTVTWYVDGIVGGSAVAGTISPAGLYTPPAAVGHHTVSATTPSGSLSAFASVYVTNYAGTFTHHNDNLRTGQNLAETVLKPVNVNTASFGKLFSDPVDGLTLASPLYVANVSVPGKGFRNVVYVATEHNSVYAFDADGLQATPLWQVSFNGPGVTPVPCADVIECGDIPNEIGITGTPVIDPATGTLYVVAKTKEGASTYVQRLHALDITTGSEKFGGPVVIKARVAGIGNGAQGDSLDFLPLLENQRPALLLQNGIVYMAFGSHGDVQPYHGWVLGYDATTLQRTMAFCVTPNHEGAGVWQGGGGLAADAVGNIYFATGDGTFTADVGGVDYGDSYVKINPAGAVLDYFTPHDQLVLDQDNRDLCAGGVLLLPDQPGAHPHLLIGAGKNATVYLVDRDQMGHFHAGDDSHAVQTLPDIFPYGMTEPGNFINPVYFNGTVYFSPVEDVIQAFPLQNGLLPLAPTSRSAASYGYPGGALAISANGSADGILWTVQRNGLTNPGILTAYDPADLGNVLYRSDQAGARDALDAAAKFNVPLVANGKVFVMTAGSLNAFGAIAPVTAVDGPGAHVPLPALAPPSPNPARDGAELAWTLARTGPVRVSILDVGGRLVRAIADGPMTAGTHRLHWDGRDDSGANVPSGLYFVRLAFGGEQRVRRLALVR